MRHVESLCDIYLSEEKIKNRVLDLGKQITNDYQGKEICIIGILKGSLIFLSDLVRCIDRPLFIELMGISSYANASKSSGIVQITHDLKYSIEGLDVLIVEDIVDTGLTLRFLLDNFITRKPNSMKVCSLLYKPDNIKTKINIDYLGFSIPDKFVVGYGLDLAGKYRNLPYIGVCKT